MPRACLCVALLASLCMAGQGMAQDPQIGPSRPRQLTPEERQERGRRLLGIGGQILQGLLQPQNGNDPNAPAPAPLDVEKLNTRFGELVRPIIEADPDVESFKLQLDPRQTDLARDRLALGGELALRKTVWSPRPTRLQVTGALRLEPTDAGPRGAAELQIKALTDVVPMLDFLLAQYRQHQGLLPAGNPVGARGVYESRLRERLLATEAITSLDDVADLMTNMAAMQLQAYNEEIDGLRRQLIVEPNEDRRRELATRLFQSRVARDAVLETQVRVLRNDHDQAEGVAIVSTNEGGRPGPERLEVLIGEDQIHVIVNVSFSEGIGIYQISKPLVVNQLRQFQNGDPATINRTQTLLRDQYQRAREKVIGERNAPEALPVPPPAEPDR